MAILNKFKDQNEKQLLYLVWLSTPFGWVKEKEKRFDNI